MTPKRFAVAALAAAAAAVPATSASAQNLEPPESDHYIPSPSIVNSDDTRFPNPPSVPGFSFDTTNFSLQTDLFNPPGSGGPPEPDRCFQGDQQFPYGKTAWAFFRAHRYGAMDLKTAGGFDSTIALIPFRSLQNATPLLELGRCTDSLSSLNEEFDNPQLVARDQWYAVQVGGAIQPDGSYGGGRVDLTFSFERPPKAAGDAILRYNGASGGLRVRELEVRAGVLSDVDVRCSRGTRCRVRRKGRLSKAAPSALGKLVEPGEKRVSGGPQAARIRAMQAASESPNARVARKFLLLKGKRLRRGTKLEVRITQPGVIGRYFRWRVLDGRPTNKVQRCLEPFSRKPQRRCNG